MPASTSSSVATLLRRADRDIRRTEKEIGTLERSLQMAQRYLQAQRDARQEIAQEVIRGASVPCPQHEDGSSRTDVLLSILSDERKPATVDTIMKAMADRGHPDDRRLVYSTLSYLKRVGRVRTTERGVWTLT